MVDECENIFDTRRIGTLDLKPFQIYTMMLDFSLPKELTLNYLDLIEPLKRYKETPPSLVRVSNAIWKILLEV